MVSANVLYIDTELYSHREGMGVVLLQHQHGASSEGYVLFQNTESNPTNNKYLGPFGWLRQIQY